MNKDIYKKSYDLICKEVLSYKFILAKILKYVLDEYEDCNEKDIISLLGINNEEDLAYDVILSPDDVIKDITEQQCYRKIHDIPAVTIPKRLLDRYTVEIVLPSFFRYLKAVFLKTKCEYR